MSHRVLATLSVRAMFPFPKGLPSESLPFVISVRLCPVATVLQLVFLDGQGSDQVRFALHSRLFFSISEPTSWNVRLELSRFKVNHPSAALSAFPTRQRLLDADSAERGFRKGFVLEYKNGNIWTSLYRNIRMGIAGHLPFEITACRCTTVCFDPRAVMRAAPLPSYRRTVMGWSYSVQRLSHPLRNPVSTCTQLPSIKPPMSHKVQNCLPLLVLTTVSAQGAETKRCRGRLPRVGSRHDSPLSRPI